MRLRGSFAENSHSSQLQKSYSEKVLRPTYNPVVAVSIGKIRLCISTPGDAGISDRTDRVILFSSIHPPPILTPPPTLASCTRALTTAVHKGSICSSTALHARSSLICINRLLKISDPHVTSSPAQRPTPKACTWPFKASHLAQSTFVCSSLFQKAQIRPAAAQPSGMELTISALAAGTNSSWSFPPCGPLGEDRLLMHASRGNYNVNSAGGETLGG